MKHNVLPAGGGAPLYHSPARVATHSYVYSSSLFVPGRVGGKHLTFLQSRGVFDRLPATIRKK